MTWLKTIQDKTHGIKSACSCGIPNCDCKTVAKFKNVTDTEDKGQYAEGAPGLNELGSLGKIIEK